METAAQSLPSAAPAETPELATTSSPPIETAPPVETVSETSPSPVLAETPSLSAASGATGAPPQPTYEVVRVAFGDYLYVREGAGADYQEVTKLEPGTGGIRLGTKRVVSGATTWQEITVDGKTGWVNAAYLAPAPQVSASPTESPTAP